MPSTLDRGKEGARGGPSPYVSSYIAIYVVSLPVFRSLSVTTRSHVTPQQRPHLGRHSRDARHGQARGGVWWCLTASLSDSKSKISKQTARRSPPHTQHCGGGGLSLCSIATNMTSETTSHSLLHFCALLVCIIAELYCFFVACCCTCYVVVCCS